MTAAIFLSASVPDPERDPKYHKTADRIAICDATRALVTVTLPHMRLVWGGHPAITPLIRVIAEGIGITGADRVRLYQSQFFRGVMPRDNAAFEQVVKTRAVRNDHEASLTLMRREMLESEKFYAGIFIGGMEGVEAEYEMFCDLHPEAIMLPVASTGGAALLIFRRGKFAPELETDLAYASLFRRLLNISV